MIMRYLTSVSSELNLRFIMVPKACTRSVLHHVGDRFDFCDVARPYHKNKNIHTFSVVRNPWDRLVSCWKDKVMTNPVAGNLDGLRQYTDFNEFVKAVHENINVDLPFSQCIIKPEQMNSMCDRHLKSQNTLVPEDSNIQIIKQEQFDIDFIQMLTKLNIQSDMDISNRLNSTNRGHYAKYYTDETRELVRQIYKDDIERFNYNFS